MFYAVGYDSACSTSSSPPPPCIFHLVFLCFPSFPVESAQRSSTLWYIVLEFVCHNFSHPFHKSCHIFRLFVLQRVCVFSIGFPNMCSLYNMCRTAKLGGVLHFCLAWRKSDNRGFSSCSCRILSLYALRVSIIELRVE